MKMHQTINIPLYAYYSFDTKHLSDESFFYSGNEQTIELLTTMASPLSVRWQLLSMKVKSPFAEYDRMHRRITSAMLLPYQRKPTDTL